MAEKNKSKQRELDIKIDETLTYEPAVFTNEEDFPFKHASEFIDDRDAFTPGLYEVKGKGGGFKVPEGEGINIRTDSVQDILKEKVPGKEYYVDPSGVPYFKQWDQKDVQDLDELFKALNLGTLDTYKGPLAKIIKNTDDSGGVKDFDAATFQDLIGQTFTKDLDKIAPRINIEELKIEATKLERSSFLRKLLTRKTSDGMDNAMFMRMLLESQILIIKLKNHTEYIQKVGYSKEADQQWREMFNYLGVLVTEGAAVTRMAMQKGTIVKNVGGSQFTSDDFLDGILSIAKDLDENAVPVNSSTFMENVQRFNRLSNGQIEHAAELAKKNGPSWWDAMAELYVNALLWHPWSIGINAAGNAVLQMADLVETFTAGAINKIPGYGAADGVALGEASDYLIGMTFGVQRGFRQMREYYKNSQTIGQTNKLDMRYDGNAMSGKLIEGSRFGNIPGIGTASKVTLNMIGSVSNVSKHAMIYSDEFTKGIIFDVELFKLANREYKIVLKRTGDEKQAQEAYQKMIHDPSDENVAKIFKAMQERTFQSELPEGVFKKAQALANVPGVKLFLPFYKTLVNIMMQTSKRTPAAMIALVPGLRKFTPNLRKELDGSNGKAAQQMAISRMVVGTAFMTAIADKIYNPYKIADSQEPVIITGRPPINKDERVQFYQQGLLPNSVCTLNPEQNNYRCVSYAGLEPVGKLISFTADAVTMTNAPHGYGDEGATAEEIAFAWMNVAFDFVGEQSFIEVFSNLDDFFNQAEQSRGLGQLALDGLYEKSLDIFDTFASVGVGRSSKYLPNLSELGELITDGDIENYVARVTDDERKNYSISSDQLYDENFFVKLISKGEASSWNEYYNGDIPASLENFYKKLNKIMHESPFFNPKLKSELTEFGLEVKNPKSRSIFAVSETDGDLIYNFFNSTGLLLDYSATKVGPVRLTADERHDFIRYMNEDNDGDGESDYKAAIRDKISDKEFLLLGQTYDRNGNAIGRKLQQDALREVQQYYRAYARRKMLSDENHADLLKRFEDKYNSVIDVGLPAPDEVIEGY